MNNFNCVVIPPLNISSIFLIYKRLPLSFEAPRVRTPTSWEALIYIENSKILIKAH